MQVTVFIERLDEHTYRAETAQPVALVTEGRRRDESWRVILLPPEG